MKTSVVLFYAFDYFWCFQNMGALQLNTTVEMRGI